LRDEMVTPTMSRLSITTSRRLQHSMMDPASGRCAWTRGGTLHPRRVEETIRRGGDPPQAAICRELAPAARLPQGHPRRASRGRVEAGLTALSPQVDRWDAPPGRPARAPAPLVRALRRHVLDPVRRARWRLAQRDENRRLRWGVGVTREAPIGAASTFSQPRARWREGAVAPGCVAHVLAPARARALRAEDPGPVDGPVLAAWAGQNSFERQEAPAPSPPPEDPGHPSLDVRGARRTHATPAATTAPEARLDTQAKGPEAQRWARGHGRMEPRPGLGVAPQVPQATGTAALPGQPRVPLGAVERHRWPDDAPSRRGGEAAATARRGRARWLAANGRGAVAGAEGKTGRPGPRGAAVGCSPPGP
jgi:hypothetical protein